jgi:hypothetical protein
VDKINIPAQAKVFKRSKAFYREDAKYAKKQQASPDLLSSFALFASLRLCDENVFMLTNGGDVNAWLSETVQ